MSDALEIPIIQMPGFLYRLCKICRADWNGPIPYRSGIVVPVEDYECKVCGVVQTVFMDRCALPESDPRFLGPETEGVCVVNPSQWRQLVGQPAMG